MPHQHHGNKASNVVRAIIVSLMWAGASTSLILLNKHILTDLQFPFPLFLGW